MDLDINIEAHDLLWRLMGPAVKKRYTEAVGGATQRRWNESTSFERGAKHITTRSEFYRILQ